MNTEATKLGAKQNTLILSAGMPRSGSTWLYNVIRLLLISSKYDFNYGWIDDVREEIGKSPLLIKVHNFDTNLVQKASMVFYSFRDIRDAMASAKRKFNSEPSLKQAHYLINNFKQWIKVSHYVMRYETMLQHSQKTIQEIAKQLGINDVDSDYIIYKLKHLSYQTNGNKNDTYHLSNLLHEGHITHGGYGTWKPDIPKDILIQIETEFSDWFHEYGYINSN